MLRTDQRSDTNYRRRSIHSMHLLGNTVQIVSGRIAPDPTVNVHEAVAIGTEMVKQYESTWPGGCHDTLPKKVRTMAITKKHIQVVSAKVYDTNLIYPHIIGLKSSGRDMKLNKVLKYELAPIPISMFTNNGEMRVATSKSTLNSKLNVEVTGRYAPKTTQLMSTLMVQPYRGWFTGQHKEQSNTSLAMLYPT